MTGQEAIMAVDYDEAYKVLNLQFGAPLEDIEAEWKLMASSFHPDKFNDGPFREKATRKLQEVNNARDQLKAWWLEHKAPPPSKHQSSSSNQNQKTGGSPPPPPTPPPPSPAPESPEVRPKFGPPPFIKTTKHHLYDAMNMNTATGRASNIAVGLSVFLAIVGFMILDRVMTIALQAVGLILQIPLYFWLPEAGGIGCLIPFGLSVWVVLELCKRIGTDMLLYKIQMDPYFQDDQLTADQAIRQLSNAITGAKFQGMEWQLKEDIKQHGNNGSVVLYSKIYEIPGPSAPLFRLHIKVAPNDSTDKLLSYIRYYSTVCYWFEIGAAQTIPNSKLVIDTDKALWQSLKPKTTT
ncbi:MAG: J domain-containing protein [Candidatus Obscuribacterales bacterium]|nr:J domain-containing protein [Candidatus Obscuribacterales bacterium]